MNLEQYWDVENKDPNFGVLMTQEEFYQYFKSNTMTENKS